MCGLGCGVPSNQEIARSSTSVEGQPSCVERARRTVAYRGDRRAARLPGRLPPQLRICRASKPHLNVIHSVEQCLGHIDEMYNACCIYVYSLCCGTSKNQARKAQLASALVPALVRERPSTGHRHAHGREPATRVVPAENPPRPESRQSDCRHASSVTSQPSCTSQRACSGPADRSSQVK